MFCKNQAETSLEVYIFTKMFDRNPKILPKYLLNSRIITKDHAELFLVWSSLDSEPHDRGMDDKGQLWNLF